MTFVDVEIDLAAERLAKTTGENPRDAVLIAINLRLEQELQRRTDTEKVVADVLAIAREYRARPILDPRSPDELLDYDENGLPT